MPDDAEILAEQIAYYRAAAGEYDDVYRRRADLRRLVAALDGVPISGDVLELACGTGIWTERLASRSTSVTAVDGSPESLAIARQRITTPSVTFVQDDLFTWRPQRRYDTVFFAFWLSHVPPARLAEFWRVVADALVPGGRAVFVDDGPGEAAHEVLLADRPTPACLRTLSDGSQHRIVKIFHAPDDLATDLTAAGWSADVRQVETFLVGVAERPGG